MDAPHLAAGLQDRATIASSPPARLIVTFSVAFAVFTILPSFLSAQLGAYPLMKVEDAFTLLTPLVLIPLYWLLLKQAAGDRVSVGAGIAFLIFAVFWIEGHGIHLAANSISHLLDVLTSGPSWQLTYFYDEVMGHYWWHLGIIGLSIVLVAAEWRSTIAPVLASTWAIGIAAFLYGATFFMAVVEGQTGPMGITFAALFTLFGLLWGRRRLSSKPILTFFFSAYLIAFVLFSIWGIYWGGLPEFSEVGIIK